MMNVVETAQLAPDMPDDTPAGFPPALWATTQPSPRVAQIKQHLLTTPRWIDVERARLSTAAYRAT